MDFHVGAAAADDLARAWDAIRAATPAGWFVSQPVYEQGRTPPWSQNAFDTTTRSMAGLQPREWTTLGMTEVDCLREMARGLLEITECRVPK
jgi:hypothetical protein